MLDPDRMAARDLKARGKSGPGRPASSHRSTARRARELDAEPMIGSDQPDQHGAARREAGRSGAIDSIRISRPSRIARFRSPRRPGERNHRSADQSTRRRGRPAPPGCPAAPLIVLTLPARPGSDTPARASSRLACDRGRHRRSRRRCRPRCPPAGPGRQPPGPGAPIRHATTRSQHRRPPRRGFTSTERLAVVRD